MYWNKCLWALHMEIRNQQTWFCMDCLCVSVSNIAGRLHQSDTESLLPAFNYLYCCLSLSPAHCTNRGLTCSLSSMYVCIFQEPPIALLTLAALCLILTEMMLWDWFEYCERYKKIIFDTGCSWVNITIKVPCGETKKKRALCWIFIFSFLY